MLDGVQKLIEKEKAVAAAPTSAVPAGGEARAGRPTAEAGPAPGSSAQQQPAQAEGKLAAKLCEEDCQQWTKHAEKVFAQHCRLMTLPASKQAFQTELASHDLGRVIGDPSGLVMIIMDVKLAGESATAPMLRMPPLKQQTYDMMVQGVLQARCRGNILQMQKIC